MDGTKMVICITVQLALATLSNAALKNDDNFFDLGFKSQLNNGSTVPSKEYLPTSEEATTLKPAELSESAESAELADDGYRYKVVRRLKYRQRRDVNEVPTNEYLPPNNEEPVDSGRTTTLKPAELSESAESAKLADDGHRYRTVHR